MFVWKVEISKSKKSAKYFYGLSSLPWQYCWGRETSPRCLRSLGKHFGEKGELDGIMRHSVSCQTEVSPRSWNLELDSSPAVVTTLTIKLVILASIQQYTSVYNNNIIYLQYNLMFIFNIQIKHPSSSIYVFSSVLSMWRKEKRKILGDFIIWTLFCR